MREILECVTQLGGKGEIVKEEMRSMLVFLKCTGVKCIYVFSESFGKKKRNYYFWNQLTDIWNNSHETLFLLPLLHFLLCSSSKLCDTGTRHYYKWPKVSNIDFTSHTTMRWAQGIDANSHRPSRESRLLVVQKPERIAGKMSGCLPLCSPPAQPNNVRLDNGPSYSQQYRETNGALAYWKNQRSHLIGFSKEFFLN